MFFFFFFFFSDLSIIKNVYNIGTNLDRNIHYMSVVKGAAMVLGKLPGLGRPTNLDNSRARAYCACSRCG